MSELKLEELEKYKEDILKAEIGALLFNLGKTHIGFWHEKDGQNYWKDNFNITDEDKFKNNFGYPPFSSYKDYHYKIEGIAQSPFEYEIEKSNLKDFIFNQKVKFPFENELDWVVFFKGDALNEGETGKEFIDKIFFRGCENINSGIDKGNPSVQLKETLWLSNAFGSFKKKVELQDFDDARICFYKMLDNFLSDNNYYAKPNWEKIREFIFTEIKNWYSRLLSDSRFPVNDVTLWDQAYMTATMFKAVLANLIIANNKRELLDDNGNKKEEVLLDYFKKDPNNIKWRILGIQYDKLGLAEKGYKPQQIQWYRETSREIDDEIKTLLEYEYPIGNEIYRDETGIYFLVGEDLGEDLNDGSNLARLKSELKKIEEKIMGIFKTKSIDEFYPAIFLTKASRGLMNLSYLLEKAKENFLKANWSKKETEICIEKSESGRAIGICQVCRQRLVFKSDKSNEDKIICNTCYREKTQGRIDKWLENIDKETIWMDELKDKNGNVALVTMKFELRDWLSGDMLNSLMNNIPKYEVESLKRDIIKSLLYPADVINNLINDFFKYFSELPADKVNELDGLYNKKIDATKLANNSSIINKKDISKVISLFNELKKKNSYIELNKIISDTIKEIKGIYEEKAHDIFAFVSSFLDYFINEDNNNSITNLRKLLNNKGKIFLNFEENLEFLMKYKDIEEVKKLLEILDEFKDRIKKLKSIVKKEGRNSLPYIEEFITSNLMPFKISPEILKYFRQYETLTNYYNILFFSSILETEWEKWLSGKTLSSKINWNDHNKEIKWYLFNNTDDDIDFLSTLILQFLLRKNPSPARLRRIWESTREFFEDIKINLVFNDENLIKIPKWRRRRILFSFKCAENVQEGIYESKGVQFYKPKNINTLYLISSIEEYLKAFKPEKLKEIEKKTNEIKQNTNKSDDEKINEILKIDIDENDVELINITIKSVESNNEYDLKYNLGITGIKLVNYQPYMSIIDPTPISWQFIIPAEYVPNLIENVMEKYHRYFKFVYGKLPLHIGVVVQDYKQPLYVGIKALRRIRRDVADCEKLEINIEKDKVERKIRKYQIKVEEDNDSIAYYSLYWGEHSNKDYEFYIKPDDKYKRWIANIDKIDKGTKITIIPNTFDFEFLDTNTRRNEIYYDKSNKWKRKVPLKSLRPYDLETWEKFKKFKELFSKENRTGVARSTRLQKMISVIYDKLEDLGDIESAVGEKTTADINNEGVKAFLSASFINILKLKEDKELAEGIKKLFDIDKCGENDNLYRLLKEKMTLDNLQFFLDMYEFWHKAIGEV